MEPVSHARPQTANRSEITISPKPEDLADVTAIRPVFLNHIAAFLT